MRKFILWLLTAIGVLAVALIVFMVNTANGKSMQDTSEFAKFLDAKGYEVTQQTRQVALDKWGFGFGQPAQYVSTDKVVFTVYEFNSRDEAKAAAECISTSGNSIRTPKHSAYISWAGHPHYYCSGNLIVLYVGSNPKVLFDMRTIMGKQTAGSKWYEILLARRG